MLSELQQKADKYESKAVRCKEWAEQAPQGPQREFFEVLATYYGNLAMDFRQAIARRSAA
jgi:hypothetical protein